ncbi:class I SAM-dependent methyltransferase [Persicimonas caeni]|uniref:Class I SAM-dependent methyltransferase n=1 Tax=Persicimonas caeni TaxID=2292766 RepID=A0A4Y6PM67_PERCE|nr:class I SAM-dependent methyltransferase [Persicimonas caeni]QDG49388.1 class I SAM-dependent methyltransferase [Persicimonas caeni]QED30609.1 class I SAM-dependent methyltransferase [Persicimonas caeni]
MSFGDFLFPLVNDLALRKATPYRARLIAKARGTVLELGAGSGLNFSHYDRAQIERVVGIEPDDTMWARGEERARKAGLDVERIDAFGEDLPLDDASVDTAVSTFVMCSVRDPEAVLAELHRVVRPGGRLLIMEHVRHEKRWMASCQQLVTPVWKRCLGGCHPGRPLQDALEASEWEPVDVDFVDLPGLPSIVSFHLVGEYRRASSPEPS